MKAFFSGKWPLRGARLLVVIMLKTLALVRISRENKPAAPAADSLQQGHRSGHMEICMSALNRIEKLASLRGARDVAKEPWLGGSWEIFEAASRCDSAALSAIWSRLPEHAKAEAMLQAAWAWGGSDSSWQAWEGAQQSVWPAAKNLAIAMFQKAIEIKHSGCASRLALRVNAVAE